jgi:PAS domain S-box-containing protein
MIFIKQVKEMHISMKGIAKLCLLVVFIYLSSYLGLEYYRPFHIATEAFSSFIAFSILMMSINTHEISNNIPFLFLGVAFGFSGVFNVIHIIASNGVGYFQGDTTNLSMTFSIIQRYMTATSILFCVILLQKSSKAITSFRIVFVFFVISSLLLLWVFSWEGFPDSYIPGVGNTPFKIVSEYILSFVTIISAGILIKRRKYIESKVFFLLQTYFYSTIFCNVLFTFYIKQDEITNVLAHILKVIAFYCIYASIVKVGLKTPYKLLFNEINRKNNSLKIKASKLKQAVYELQKESELRKNIEDMFIENEACYKLLIENSRDIIIIYNEAKIVFANEGAAGIIGIDMPEKLLGKSVNEFLHQHIWKKPQKMFEENSSQNIPPVYETELVSVDGRITPVEVTSIYISYNKEPAVLSLIRDISSQKQIEKMKKAVEEDKKLLNETLEFNRLITEFFSNVSHELRTPLNVILSALQVLALEENKVISYQEEEKKRRYIQTMKQNCYRLLRLINNLIDITRIDSGYIQPNMQNHNIVSVVEDITLSVVEYAQSKGIELIFDTNVEEKVIACDPDIIERIMLNLISNAIKFTEEGEQISVELIAEDDNVNISVKDSGIGIPDDKCQIIFERFRQADNSLSRNHEGSGIGLSLVKAFVEMHGGDISVISELGKGSEFIINLPVGKAYDTENTKNNIISGGNSEKISIEFSDIN